MGQVAETDPVGRKADLEALQAQWTAAIAGAPQLALIAGETGMGRSTLLRAFIDRARGRGQVLYGHCLPIQRASFGTLADILTQLLGCEEDAPPAELAASLELHLARHADPGGLRSLVGHLLRIDTPPPALGPDALRHAALTAVSDMLELFATAQPLLIAIEDLHWADPGTSEWLLSYCRRLSLATGPRHVLVAATCIPDVLAAPLANLGALAGVGASRFEGRRYDLGPLAMTEAMDLAGRHLGARPAAWSPALRRVVKQVLDRAEGHPAYLVETLDALIASGVLTKAGADWEAASAEAVDLPDSVSAAIAARLQALPEQLRDRLQLAAVAGSRFDPRLLGAAFEGAIAEGLDELVRLRLLSAGGVSETVRLVTRDHIGQQRLRELHLQVGEALETLLGPMARRFAGELAHHFGEAGDPPRAYKYRCILAERARETGLAGDACRWYQEALPWAEKIEDWSDPALVPEPVISLRMAVARAQLGHFEDAVATLDALAKRAPLSPEALRARGAALERLGDMKGCLDAIQQACRRAGGDGLEAGRSLLALADTQRRMGQFAEAVATVQQAKAMLGPTATPAENALGHGILGVCYRRLGDGAKALEEHRQALAIRQEAGDLEGIANSLNNIGILTTAAREYQQAEEAYGQSLAMFCRLGIRPGAVMVLNNLGELYIKQGRDREAEARIREAQALAEQLGYVSERVTTNANLAEIFLKRGNHGEALRLLERCLSQAVRAGLREFLPEIHAARGRAYAAAGDRALASMAFAEACELAEIAGNEAFATEMRKQQALLSTL